MEELFVDIDEIKAGRPPTPNGDEFRPTDRPETAEDGVSS